MVLSPITHKPAKLIESISTGIIKKEYQKGLDIDVENYFKGQPEIQIYRCEQTGYRFYYPFHLAGDSSFYEKLEKFDWYYADWKWDYNASFPHIDLNSKVLDIGCGYGNFLVHLKDKKGCDCTGLEFNASAVETGNKRGIKIYNQTVQEHAEKHGESYDVVCFFQVLEHIAEVDSFLTAAIKCLKKGGKLLICVPNNNPYFYKYDKYHSLNMPPHHMCLWNKEAFEALINIYALKLTGVFEERLHRFRFFTRIFISHKSKPNSIKRWMLTLLTPFLIAYFITMRNKIKAGSILVIYQKQ